MERKFEGNDRMNSKEKGRIGKKIRKKLEKKSIKNFKSVNLMKLKIKKWKHNAGEKRKEERIKEGVHEDSRSKVRIDILVVRMHKIRKQSFVSKCS